MFVLPSGQLETQCPEFKETSLQGNQWKGSVVTWFNDASPTRSYFPFEEPFKCQNVPKARGSV